jgi:penicillin amidase
LTTTPIGVRLVRAVNFLIILVLATGLAAIWWFALRPLPQRSGTIGAPVSQPVSVTFDTLGVPHIQAASIEDALVAQGYVTAQDRLFQMDALRRFDAGELAEVFGPVALDNDRESRRLRLRRIAEAAYVTMPEADRNAMAAYARGVNAYIESHLGNLPVEFTLARYQPRPWSVVDSLLICLHMFRSLTTTWKDELIKREMMKEGDPKLVEALFPPRSGAEVQPGSNAWALAGSRTASGKPLLSNDMHLEYSIPGIWYMTQIEAPGLDVSGVALPGTPGVIVGHNRRIAWGITNLQFDVQDLYIEKLDQRTGRYVYQGGMEQARPEREIIRVKGQPSTEQLTWVTRHGPLFVTEGGEVMTLRWAAAEPGLLQFPILDINRAENWKDFTAALSRFPGPGSNFVYADVDGNIGYHAAGKLPKRRGYLGDLPVDGSTGEHEWDGFIPFDELPQSFNPASGMIVSANQNPFPPDYPYPVNGSFAAHHRLLQIRNLLSARKGWRADELIAVQKDVYSSFDHFLAQQLVNAYQKRNAHVASLDAVVALLRGWNGQMDKSLIAPFVTTLAFQHVRTAMVERAAPGKALAYDYPMSRAVVERLLRERPAEWFRDFDEMLLRALVDAVDEGKRMQGSDVQKWQYGRWLRVRIDHPVVHQVPSIGSYFDLGPVPMSGGPSTPKQTTTKLAPSMRMDADLGDWERSLLNITIGQSGQIFSSHYRDQWEHYYYAQSYPMQFGKVAGKSNLLLEPGK